MTAYKLLVIIPYSRSSCFAPTDIFALRQMHPREHLSFAFIIVLSPLASIVQLASADSTQRKNAFYKNEMLPAPDATDDVTQMYFKIVSE